MKSLYFVTENFIINSENINSLNSEEKVLFVDFFSSAADYLADSEVKLRNEYGLSDTQVRKIYYGEDEDLKQKGCRKWLLYKNHKFYCTFLFVLWA